MAEQEDKRERLLALATRFYDEVPGGGEADMVRLVFELLVDGDEESLRRLVEDNQDE